MTFDGATERANVQTRVASLCGGRTFEGLADDVELAVDPVTGLILPYIVWGFGAMIPTANDRTMGNGEDGQPMVWPLFFECWAASQSVANDTAGAVRTKFLNWSPNDPNTSPLALGGGREFSSKDANGRPTRFLTTQNFTTTLNLSTP